tara:strand:- start:99 stop:314 length:216 start_codon:yes stop_codon:yes gene_type:complete
MQLRNIALALARSNPGSSHDLKNKKEFWGLSAKITIFHFPLPEQPGSGSEGVISANQQAKACMAPLVVYKT